MSTRNRISKTNSKSSDRRLASGIRPESFLLSHQKNNISIKPTTTVPSSSTTTIPSKPGKFRLFVGNLGPDANSCIVRQAFVAYPSLATVEVPVGPKNTNKGFAFVSFTDADDYLKAFREVQGKYVGLHPCVLKRANDINDKNKRKKDQKGKKI